MNRGRGRPREHFVKRDRVRPRETMLNNLASRHGGISDITAHGIEDRIDMITNCIRNY